MSKTELPDSIDGLLEAFPALTTADWMERVTADLCTNAPREAIQFDTCEGFSLQAFYRDDDAEAKPLNIPAMPERTARCAQLSLDQSPSHQDIKTALATDPKHLHVALSPASEIAAEDLHELIESVASSGTCVHLDAQAASPALGAIIPQMPDFELGSLALDVPGVFAATGALPENAAEIISSISHASDSSRTIAADGRYHRNSGGTLVHELAGILGSATDSIDLLGDRMDVPEIHRRLFFIVPVGRALLLQVAKLRALRILHNRWASAYLDGDVPPAHIFAETSRRSETACDPHSNVLRATAGVASAYLGGADVVSARPHDSLSPTRSTGAQRLANNTPLIIEQETDFSAYRDIAHGSYFLEAATRKLVETAWDEFLWIEEQGGLIEALKSGRWQARIAENRASLLDSVKTRRKVLVGTTNYARAGEVCESEPDSVSEDDAPAISNNSIKWNDLVDQAGSGASISQLHRLVFSGEHAATCEPLPSIRLATPFEELRREVAAFQEELGRELDITLLAYGPPALRAAKDRFSRDYLAAAGLKVTAKVTADAGADPSDISAPVETDVLIVCAPDSRAAEICANISQEYTSGDNPLLGVAGKPDDRTAEKGARFFIHRGSNLPETARRILSHFIQS